MSENEQEKLSMVSPHCKRITVSLIALQELEDTVVNFCDFLCWTGGAFTPAFPTTPLRAAESMDRVAMLEWVLS